MGWRRFNRALHRDLGYLCVGFTLLYALSGFLLNHLHDMNPMYAISGSAVSLGPLPPLGEEAQKEWILSRLGVTAKPTGSFRPDERSLELFFEGGDRLSVDLSTGAATLERVRRRGFTAWINELHLNKPRGSWTLIADGYAVALGLLAVSGALLAARPGRIDRRGLLFVAAGLGLAATALFYVV